MSDKAKTTPWDSAALLDSPERIREYIKAWQEECAIKDKQIEVLLEAIGNLEPLRELDFHGKWRIHKILDVADRIKEGL